MLLEAHLYLVPKARIKENPLRGKFMNERGVVFVSFRGENKFDSFREGVNYIIFSELFISAVSFLLSGYET